MWSGPYALALATGMVATVNPCGFALLPAYLTAFVSLDEPRGKLGAVGRALTVSAALTAGFVSVFTVFGAIIDPLSAGIERYLPWATIVIGVALVVLGACAVAGKQWSLALPKYQRGPIDGTISSMYLFGVSYAVASLSCASVFFVSSTFTTDSFWSGVVGFVMYGLGMGAVVAVLTVAVALARTSVVAAFRRSIPVMNRVAGVLLIIAGAYVAYYGWWEVRVFEHGYRGSDPVVTAVGDIQQRFVSYFPDRESAPTYLIVAVVLLMGAIAWSRYALRRPASADIE